MLNRELLLNSNTTPKYTFTFKAYNATSILTNVNLDGATISGNNFNIHLEVMPSKNASKSIEANEPFASIYVTVQRCGNHSIYPENHSSNITVISSTGCDIEYSVDNTASNKDIIIAVNVYN